MESLQLLPREDECPWLRPYFLSIQAGTPAEKIVVGLRTRVAMHERPAVLVLNAH